MVNDVLDGISNALYKVFEGVEIRTEGLEQGFVAPSFFVDIVSTMDTPLLGNRAFRTMEFDVSYFPESETELNNECEKVASQLYGALRFIDLLDGTKLRGLELNHKVVDDVLHFFVKYKPIVYYIAEIPEKQGEIDVSVEVKHD